MDSERAEKLSAALAAMPEQWRKRWCGSSLCGCMGAANCSGGLRRLGFTREEWRSLMIESYQYDPDNPPPCDEFESGVAVLFHNLGNKP